MKKLIVFILVTLSFLFSPQSSFATGELVRGESFDSVYYLAANNRRYVFPTEGVYRSWYNDFSNIRIINDQELYAMPLGGNVTYRPGYKMIKLTTDPKVYAVDRSGRLRWVINEQIEYEISN